MNDKDDPAIEHEVHLVPRRTYTDEGIRKHGDPELVEPFALGLFTECWAQIWRGDDRAWVQCVSSGPTAKDAYVTSVSPVRQYEARIRLRDLRVRRGSPYAKERT